MVADIETRVLLDTRELITTQGLHEAHRYISEKPHPRWAQTGRQDYSTGLVLIGPVS